MVSDPQSRRTDVPGNETQNVKRAKGRGKRVKRRPDVHMRDWDGIGESPAEVRACPRSEVRQDPLTRVGMSCVVELKLQVP